ncbi:uncharacterized protein LOC110644828 [Hevea brasiliensis]|uniref:uncharacterized protein LOC110644828 n=1 Tax=Hevea brasiliensis TaxID=3981 RepID=UPI0025FA3F59|nr:uncharacterized protein LOC110644828 [Hevea brasiliensis]
MVSKADVPHQQLKEEVKPKNVVVDGRNKRALKDIGNLESDRALQLKKPVTDISNVVGAGRGPMATRATTKKLVEKKHAPETVIVISSNDESEKSKTVGRRVSNGRVFEEGVITLTNPDCSEQGCMWTCQKARGITGEHRCN